MGSSYWLHTIAPDSDSLVNLTTERRNEIVLFGSVWPLRGPFSFPLGNEFTITAKADSTSVTITRLAGDKRDKDDELATVTATHRADLHEVLKGLAALGGSYSEAIEFIGRANRADVLVVPLAIDSAPRGFAVTDLVRISSNDPQLEKANATVEKQKDGSQTGAPIVPADMPTDGDAIRAQPASEPALNRNHGSIFRPFEAEKLGPTLNRNPGTVFSK